MLSDFFQIGSASANHIMGTYDLHLVILSIMVVVTSASCILGIVFSLSAYRKIWNYRALNLAHQSGMAEVSANVLHNVGNVLNSVNISASRIKESFANSEMKGLIDLHELLRAHKESISSFITSSRGDKVPAYIELLAGCWQNESALITNEIDKLIKNIQHIKHVIHMQQSMCVFPHMEEVVVLEEILEEALYMASINSGKINITIEIQTEKMQPFLVEKTKLLQILINLIRNAKHALLESSNANKLLTIKSSVTPHKIVSIQIIDNGVGIKSKHLTTLFTHGFTTKKNGHGFGLHASAIAAKEMGGSLKAATDGPGKGATFTLELPYKVSAIPLQKQRRPMFDDEGEEENVTN